MVLKQSGTFVNFSVTDLIGKVQSQELTMRKKQKMHLQAQSMVQDPHLYMGGKDSFGDLTIEDSGPKLQTAFYSGSGGPTSASNPTGGADFSYQPTGGNSYGSPPSAPPTAGLQVSNVLFV